MKIINQAKNFIILCIALLYLASIPAVTTASDDHESVPLQKGAFLVAKPHLSDPNFIHSVILLVSYGKEGAMGVVINKPAFLQLRNIVPEVKGLQGAAIPVYKGGPVNLNDISILFTSDKPEEDALQVTENLYFSAKKEAILARLHNRPLDSRIRIYAGYSGWAPGQLEHEINSGDWITIKSDVDKIFSWEPSRIWPSIFPIREDLMI